MEKDEGVITSTQKRNADVESSVTRGNASKEVPMALRKDLQQVLSATCRLLDSTTLPRTRRVHLQREVDLQTAARKALLKRLWVSRATTARNGIERGPETFR